MAKEEERRVREDNFLKVSNGKQCWTRLSGHRLLNVIGLLRALGNHSPCLLHPSLNM